MEFTKEFAGNYYTLLKTDANGRLNDTALRELLKKDWTVGEALFFQWWKKRWADAQGTNKCPSAGAQKGMLNGETSTGIMQSGGRCSSPYFFAIDYGSVLGGAVKRKYNAYEPAGKECFIEGTFMPMTVLFPKIPINYFLNWGGDVAKLGAWIRKEFSEGAIIGLRDNKGRVMKLKFYRAANYLYCLGFAQIGEKDSRGNAPALLTSDAGIDVLFFTPPDEIEQRRKKEDEIWREEGEQPNNEQPNNEQPKNEQPKNEQPKNELSDENFDYTLLIIPAVIILVALLINNFKK